MLKIHQIKDDNDIDSSISINVSTKFGVNLISDLRGNEKSVMNQRTDKAISIPPLRWR